MATDFKGAPLSSLYYYVMAFIYIYYNSQRPPTIYKFIFWKSRSIVRYSQSFKKNNTLKYFVVEWFCLHGETKIYFVKIVSTLYNFFPLYTHFFSFRLNSDQQLYIMKDQSSTFYFRNVCCKYLIKWPMYALQNPYPNNDCRIEYYTT